MRIVIPLNLHMHSVILLLELLTGDSTVLPVLVFFGLPCFCFLARISLFFEFFPFFPGSFGVWQGTKHLKNGRIAQLPGWNVNCHIVPVSRASGGRNKGNTIGGDRTESLWEGNLPLRGSLRGPLRGRASEVFRHFQRFFRGPLRDPLRDPLRGSRSCCPYYCCPLIFLQAASKCTVFHSIPKFGM